MCIKIALLTTNTSLYYISKDLCMINLIKTHNESNCYLFGNFWKCCKCSVNPEITWKVDDSKQGTLLTGYKKKEGNNYNTTDL